MPFWTWCADEVEVDVGISVVTGRVIRFDELRGYGFVAPDEGREDVFLHANDLDCDKRLLVPGARVQFFVEEGDRGLKASQVRLLDEPAQVLSGPALVSVPSVSDHTADAPVIAPAVAGSAAITAALTESLLAAVPSLSGEQIVQARQCLIEFADARGWLRH